ncbi:hypothetical protein BJ322DRAFT_1018063 [Thelephora terrestris]|uniref:Uncharacterized protein n=1 Tax=Thelephora terrestris TaxID=56493 RepID=A0A9P6HNN5_9AGAM|nr:hypothetical protein BJ322DRAFT_1018063 [Thelephora terrestris]
MMGWGSMSGGHFLGWEEKYAVALRLYKGAGITVKPDHDKVQGNTFHTPSGPPRRQFGVRVNEGGRREGESSIRVICWRFASIHTDERNPGSRRGFPVILTRWDDPGREVELERDVVIPRSRVSRTRMGDAWGRFPGTRCEKGNWANQEPLRGKAWQIWRAFIASTCSEIKSYRYGLDDWATEKQLDLLCRRAAGVFIYATAKVLV